MAMTVVKIHVVATMNFWLSEQCIAWTLPIRNCDNIWFGKHCYFVIVH